MISNNAIYEKILCYLLFTFYSVYWQYLCFKRRSMVAVQNPLVWPNCCKTLANDNIFEYLFFCLVACCLHLLKWFTCMEIHLNLIEIIMKADPFQADWIWIFVGSNLQKSLKRNVFFFLKLAMDFLYFFAAHFFFAKIAVLHSRACTLKCRFQQPILPASHSYIILTSGMFARTYSALCLPACSCPCSTNYLTAEAKFPFNIMSMYNTRLIS